jgi:hypothetical protein
MSILSARMMEPTQAFSQIGTEIRAQEREKASGGPVVRPTVHALRLTAMDK